PPPPPPRAPRTRQARPRLRAGPPPAAHRRLARRGPLRARALARALARAPLVAAPAVFQAEAARRAGEAGKAGAVGACLQPPSGTWARRGPRALARARAAVGGWAGVAEPA